MGRQPGEVYDPGDEASIGDQTALNKPMVIGVNLYTPGIETASRGDYCCHKESPEPSNFAPAMNRFGEVARKRAIALGGAAETSAGRLPFRAIIHVAGLDLFWRASERAIRACVRSALSIAHKRGCRSVAFPLSSAGTGGCSAKRALAVMQDEARHTDYEGEVRLVRCRART